MLIDFFTQLRAAGIPVSTQEYLSLLELLSSPAAPTSTEDFYHLARMALVKDETRYDRYDRVFASFIGQLQARAGKGADIPADWLMQTFRKHLSDAEKAALEKYGWDRLMEMFRERLAEQKERHAGGSKWIGTGGSSPYGHGGYHPEGIRIGGPSAGNRTAVKVWEQRHYRDYDDQQALGTRNFKMALRRLRRFARQGAALELDMPGTIRGTAEQAGLLDLRWVPERHNTVKVLMLLDVGGSMDDHIARIEALFSAARSEFKHLEVFYFHNCPYESVWRHNERRRSTRIDTQDLLRSHGEDWRLILVGDASMSPYELLYPGGSIEHHNTETGATWLQRLLGHWPHAVWLNPEPSGSWQYRQSIALVRELMHERMFGMTIDGLEQAMRLLSK
ncbi:vWA domain-containing protein [Castellaniella caeni]|uniref:vWA domain-containing protein n=1 Tax=Castellaniella caeni TaxID=266123 RepID=UPI00082DA144|nr:VWA domain-containing protein [Castellaniella caeni]